MGQARGTFWENVKKAVDAKTGTSLDILCEKPASQLKVYMTTMPKSLGNPQFQAVGGFEMLLNHLGQKQMYLDSRKTYD